MITAIFGAVMGAAQFLLLRGITVNLIGNTKKIVILIIIKILLYAVSIALVMTVAYDDILLAGIGYSAGLLIGALVCFIVAFRNAGKENKEN